MNIVGASGSAIFVTGSSVAKFDITFPSWSVDDQKNYYEYSVGAKLLTAYYPPKYGRASYLTGSAIAGGTYAGFITAPNGNIYAIPSTATGSVKFNTTGSSSDFTYITTSSLPITTPKFNGAALAGNGCIYMVPFGASTNPSTIVAKIDTNTDQISVLGNIVTTVNAPQYWGAVCAPNGFIYAIPFAASNILKINPNDDTLSYFGNVTGSGNPNFVPFQGGVLASNGVIYCAPRDFGLILKIDTNTDTLSTVNIGLPNTNGANRWNGGVLAPNNECIYFIPTSSTGSLKIDPRTDQITFINLPGSSNFGNSGGIVGPDGLIYGNQPANGNSRVVINPFNDTISVVPAVNGANYGSAMGFNGKIYSINGATNRLYVLEDNRTYDLDPNYILSRYRNKL